MLSKGNAIKQATKLADKEDIILVEKASGSKPNFDYNTSFIWSNVANYPIVRLPDLATLEGHPFHKDKTPSSFEILYAALKKFL